MHIKYHCGFNKKRYVVGAKALSRKKKRSKRFLLEKKLFSISQIVTPWIETRYH